MLRTALLLIIGFLPRFTGQLSSEQILRQMYDRYHGKWFSNLTFLQTTESYKKDTLTSKTTWYEAVAFPDKFRIDFGHPSEGNAVIFRNDSVYSFQKGSLKHAALDKNDLTFLLGGLYFYSFDEVLKQVSALHYDLSKFHEDVWKGKAVYVIGAGPGEEKLLLVRMIKYDDHRKEEGLFEKHIQLGGGWSETLAIFYVDDQLLQKEYYYDCKANITLDPGVFEPASFGKIHWYQ